MAGLGRRTHYRKHLTDQVLFDLPEPSKTERIAKVVATRGSNQFDVQLEDAAGTDPVLAILPTKFRKLVWVKRNDFVIVQTVEDSDDVDAKYTGIRYMINHILYKDQIEHLQSKGLWPETHPAFVCYDEEIEQVKENDDGIVYQREKEGNEIGDSSDVGGDSDGDDDRQLFVNTNRVAKIALEDSSSSDEGD
jgi:probable RNA-binding protein EIF1AD